MCGIAGKFTLDDRPIDAGLITRMAERLSHRGPDDAGYHVSGPIGLASRRLSIIDLATGRQPISNEDGTVWVVLNGEIYNFVELRATLERRGHCFRTRTDTEVIVHLYEDEGPGLLEHLRGMFAFALWDVRRRQLLLARDRLGEKPLFYAHRPGRALLFASELKSLLVDPEIQPSINVAAVDQYLSLLYIPAPATIFSEIKKLPAGHYLTCTEQGIEVHEYWDVPLPPEGEEDRLDEESLRAQLREAVRIQLRSDVPLGAFLSGGIDSTTVVAAMSPARELIERLSWHFDEPFGDSSAVPTWEVSGLARERVKVALSGDGGDELFGGYARHATEKWEHALRRCGRAAAWTMARVAAGLPAGLTGRNALTRLAGPPDQACAVKFQFGRGAPQLKARIYAAGFRDAIATIDPLAPFKQAYARAGKVDPLNRILYVDLKTYLADDILVKVDRMSMAHGLEVRAPFLDHRLVEMVARLPGRTKVTRLATKPLLRAALDGRVPRTAWDRPKHGFTAPIGLWLRNGLRDCVEERLFSRSSLGRDLFDPKGLRQLWEDHRTGRGEHAHEIWMLLMLETWYGLHARARAAA